MHRKEDEEILVLDAVGICEDLTGTTVTVSEAAPTTNDNDSCSQDQAKLGNPDGLSLTTTHSEKDELTGLPTELDDDILSIMCDDHEEDLLDVEGDGPPEKREWNSESKRKPDQLTDTSQPVNSKRPRSVCKMPPQCSRSQAGSVHNRLGRQKAFQYNQEGQKPCFKSRDSSNWSRENELVPNRRSRMENYDNKMFSLHARQMTELKQKVQEQETQLVQQSAQLQSMAHDLLKMEHVANHAANQAKQVQESFYHLWQEREQLNHSGDVLDQLGRDHCKMGEDVRTLQDQVQHLEASEYSQLDILAHYQFIANFQRRQLQHFHRNQAAAGAAGAVLGDALPSLQLPDLRHLSSLGKPVVIPPRPRSAFSSFPQPGLTGSHHPSQVASLQSIPSSSYPSVEGEGGQPALFPSATFQGPSMIHTSRISFPRSHTPGNPRVVRIVPVQQQCPDPYHFVDYQHKSPTVRLQ